MPSFISPSILPLVISVCLLSTASTTYAANTDSKSPDKLAIDNEKLTLCLNNLVQTAPFASVKEVFAQYQPTAVDPSVLESLNYQPEFDKEPWDYLASLVDEERVVDGIRASERYAEVLAKIESHYGVNRYDVLGVWGVESNFGTTLGKKDVINSLATLSCFGRRQGYFRGEYLSALKILKQGDIAKSDFKGSWAGAFGQTQFMPSTFLQLAQDFDGDNRKDLVNSHADALASTANFLKNSGYQSHQPWGYEVRLPAAMTAVNARKNKKPLSHWQGLGVTLADGRPLPNTLSSAGLFLPAGNKGPAFLVGRNFDAFYAYNASENYALAIAHLSQRIEQKNPTVAFTTAWPTDDAGLSRKHSREVQESLNLLGYDVGEVDGIIGDGTRRVIQQYQTDSGMTADGRAGTKLHQRLMTLSADLREAPAKKASMTLDSNGEITAPPLNVAKETTEEKSNTNRSIFTKYKIFISVFMGLFALIMIAALVLITKKR